MATQPKRSRLNKNSPNSETKFLGPAQKLYKSFSELALDSLDRNCPNWRNYVEPKSYFIPPIFYFQYPGDSDAVVEIAKSRGAAKDSNGQPEDFALIKHRDSDEAEYTVYRTIQKLSKEPSMGPFIAVHSLDLSGRLKNELKQIFPHIGPWRKYESAFREYDFLLAGPKIGIVAIEVKHSPFTQGKHFEPGQKRLPEDIVKAVEIQLGSTTALLEMLQECAGTGKLQEVHIRKVLVMTNLAKNRYDAWVQSLAQLDQEKIRDRIGDVHLIFTEDTLELRQKFEELLKNPKARLTAHQYEAYGSHLAGLASAVVLKNAGKKNAELDQLHLSEIDATLNESRRIETQNFANAAAAAHHSGELKKSDKLQVHHWTEVSSREWPVVILAVCMCKVSSDRRLALPSIRYRAASRATGKLIEIDASYEYEDDDEDVSLDSEV